MFVVGNFYFSIFLRLTWEFLDPESERGGSVCWPNNKIIDRVAHALAAQGCKYPQNAVLLWDSTPPGVEGLVASDDLIEPLS